MAPYKVVVPVSGGKDSQACLKLATQRFSKEEILGLFCDTKFEHPLTYKHVDWMREFYDVEIDTICMGSVLQESEKWGRFPGGGSRHCTDYLKIQPTKQYIKTLAEKQGGFEVWYGMRSEESHQREKLYEFKESEDLYEPHEVMPSKYPQYLGKMGVRFRLAVLDWTTEEVFKFLEGQENPLYKQGFDRVGCFPCLAAGDQWKEKAFKHDETGRLHYEQAMIVSEKIGKSLWTSQRGKWNNERGQGCLICEI